VSFSLPESKHSTRAHWDNSLKLRGPRQRKAPLRPHAGGARAYCERLVDLGFSAKRRTSIRLSHRRPPITDVETDRVAEQFAKVI
jgi:hypothetical protein